MARVSGGSSMRSWAATRLLHTHLSLVHLAWILEFLGTEKPRLLLAEICDPPWQFLKSTEHVVEWTNSTLENQPQV